MSSAPFRLSVIIQNYNYEKYVGTAIESALNLDWPDVEVVIVDDGSTDGSRRVIERYADRAKVVFKDNGKQYTAYNAGYAVSTGDAVLFLDSDDVLHPSLVRAMAPSWQAGVSKIQFQMRVVDERGQDTGRVLPQYAVVPTPADIQAWYRATATYPTPPGSANVYARAFLDKIFPIDNSCGYAGDSACLAAAPLFGDIVTIAETLVDYRVHGANDGAMQTMEVSRFAREMVRAQQRFAYMQKLTPVTGIAFADPVIDLGLAYLPYRLASFKLAPAAHPRADDGVWRLIVDLWRASRVPQGLSPKAAYALFGWGVAVLLLPRAAARHLISWRFAPATRPRALIHLMKKLRILR